VSHDADIAVKLNRCRARHLGTPELVRATSGNVQMPCSLPPCGEYLHAF
jgi:hypothetical protein